MKNNPVPVLAGVLLVNLLTACGGASFTNVDVITAQRPITSISIGADSGVIGEYLGPALARKGYQVLGMNETHKLTGELDTSGIEHLEALKAAGVDIHLTCRTTFANVGQVNAVAVNAVSTESATSVLSFNWEIARGGRGLVGLGGPSPAEVGEQLSSKIHSLLEQ